MKSHTYLLKKGFQIPSSITLSIFCRLETIDGSAVEEEDYKPLNETLTFEPNERTKEIGLEIVDDNQWEPDEEFFVKLTLIPQESENVRLGRMSIMEITVLNDDEPGTITFEKRGYLVKESCREAEIAVLRQNGADGEISIKWRTIDKSGRSRSSRRKLLSRVKSDH